jgi:hypothetical protein
MFQQQTTTTWLLLQMLSCQFSHAPPVWSPYQCLGAAMYDEDGAALPAATPLLSTGPLHLWVPRGVGSARLKPAPSTAHHMACTTAQAALNCLSEPTHRTCRSLMVWAVLLLLLPPATLTLQPAADTRTLTCGCLVVWAVPSWCQLQVLRLRQLALQPLAPDGHHPGIISPCEGWCICKSRANMQQQ